MSDRSHPLRNPLRRAAATVGAIACALALALPAAADHSPEADAKAKAPQGNERHERYCEFFATGRYQVFVDGKEVRDAAVYYTRSGGALLVQNTPYNAPFLVCLRHRTVERVDAADFVPREGRSCYDLRRSAVLTRIGTIRFQDRDILVDAEGLVARLNPRSEVTGSLTGDDLLEIFPDYVRDAESYPVDAQLIRQLSSLERGAEVVVYFGTWCHTCKRLLGRVLRVEKELADTGIRFTYYAVPKPPAMYRDEAVRRDSIRKLPTGVIEVNDRAAGSIVSMAWSRPESALLQILSRSGS